MTQDPGGLTHAVQQARVRLALRTRFNRQLDQVLRRRYRFVGDGIATSHLCAFEEDPTFLSTWPIIEAHWQPGLDVRWRVWLLRKLAETAARLDGSFAEFGTYRGGCAAVALAAGVLEEGRSFYLFDTFSGIAPGLDGVEADLVGEFTNTSPDYAMQLLSRWDRDNVRLVVGDVAETLRATETGPLAFVHIDLNVAEPTGWALEYAYERLVPGGIVLFDDYGWDQFLPQRRVIDQFAGERSIPMVTFPTGTAMLMKA